MSVSLCTYDRPDVFLESLESLCRQQVRPGTFEIVIVDDGDPRGTESDLRGLSFAVPVVYVRGPGRGLAAARNAGLRRSRGDYVLFVNDDTIASPHLVEEHLRCQAGLAPTRAAVVGTFEQPTAALDNALLRHLEGSNEVFDYVGMRPGQWQDGLHLYTCNASVAREELQAVGGFDESFRAYGCEDSDLGVRLEARGCRVWYEPAARAQHHHWMDVAYLRKRQRGLAESYVHFFRKHPQRLQGWSLTGVSARYFEDSCAADQARAGIFEGALEELGRLDVGALERFGGCEDLLRDVNERLQCLLPSLNQMWWRQGFLAGLARAGLSGFDFLWSTREPWPLQTNAARRVLACPDWTSEASLQRLLERAAPLSESPGDVALVLLMQRADDQEQARYLLRLQEAYARVFTTPVDLEVLLETSATDRTSWMRLGRSVDAFLPLGHEDPGLIRDIVAEALPDVAAVRAWQRRFGAAAHVEVRAA